MFIRGKKIRLVLVSVAPCLLAASAMGALLIQATAARTMSQYAQELIRISDEGQRAALVLEYDDPQRVDWHFIPKPTRKGLMIKNMNEAQRTAALRLLNASLSDVGYDKATKIMLLEGVLRQLEGPGSEQRRDPEKYYVTLFGDPAGDDAWGFSFEGHHMSLNFVVEGDTVVDSTPQFYGANPATVMSEVEGPLEKGMRVLKAEEDVAFDLLESLGDEARGVAIIAEEAPAEIRAAGEPQPPSEQPVGLSYADMSGASRRVLQRLVGAYLENVPESVRQQRRSAIEEAGWDNVHFAWAGAQKTGIGHYYRVQGPSFLIEFVNTQPDPAGNPANHIHCVWRDMNGDFNLPVN